MLRLPEARSPSPRQFEYGLERRVHVKHVPKSWSTTDLTDKLCAIFPGLETVNIIVTDIKMRW